MLTLSDPQKNDNKTVVFPLNRTSWQTTEFSMEGSKRGPFYVFFNAAKPGSPVPDGKMTGAETKQEGEISTFQALPLCDFGSFVSLMGTTWPTWHPKWGSGGKGRVDSMSLFIGVSKVCCEGRTVLRGSLGWANCMSLCAKGFVCLNLLSITHSCQWVSKDSGRQSLVSKGCKQDAKGRQAT